MKNNKKFVECIFLVVLLAACLKPTPEPVPVVVPEPFNSYYDLTSLPISNAFDEGITTGTLQDQSLDEISGMAASPTVTNGLWVEEDSGNENKIYMVNTTGDLLGTFRMTSVSNRDWEDLSIVRDRSTGVNYMYLAETGDNKFSYPIKYIYRFPEPMATQPFPINGEINSIEKISFQYPDGIKNAEAVMVDPGTQDIYVISKEGQAVVYVARYPQDVTATFTLTKLGLLPISDVTAADISPDGKEVVIKNYSTILYWRKTADESISELLKITPQRLPYSPESKGESICWASDGSGYIVTSEGTSQPVVFYQRKK